MIDQRETVTRDRTIYSTSGEALDYRVGDLVQIRAKGYRHNGEIGTVIGIRLKLNKYGKYQFFYTVKLGEKKAVEMNGNGIRYIKGSTR